MATSEHDGKSKLWEQFQQFRGNSIERFRVMLRRVRAEQIRRLLSDPDQLTLDSFNREVWPIVHDLRLDGELLREDLFAEDMTEARASELEAAILAGRLEVHGNSIWGSATRLYGSALKDDETRKRQLIQQAARVLSDASLSALRKAQTVEAIRGFGPNSAGGLAMVFHPKEFAICNQPSQGAMRELGFPAGTLEEYQASAARLLSDLGADDFLELDWFLYLMHEGRLTRRYWWVNHGKLYEAERDAGVLAAPVSGTGGRTLAHWQNVLRVRPGDRIVHYVRGQVISVSVAQAAGHQVHRLPYGREEAGPFNKVPLEYTDLQSPVPKEAIPLRARRGEKGPFDKNGDVKQAFLFPLSKPFVSTLADLSPELGRLLKEDAMPPQPKQPAPPQDTKPLNLILYGPPGTGKTYITLQKAVEICDGQAPSDRRELMTRFRQLQQDKRIAMVTFHQSYGYEEFVEGIRPVLTGEPATPPGEANGDTEGDGQIRYECRPGIFRKICLDAKTPARPKHAFDFADQELRFWKMSLGNINDPTQSHIYDECIEKGCILLDYGHGLDFAGCDDREAVKKRLQSQNPDIKNSDFHLTSVNVFKNEMKKGDIVIVSDGLYRFRAIGRITGDYRLIPTDDYEQMRPVDWLLVLDESLPHEKIMNKAISQKTLYELRPAVLRMDAIRELLSVQGGQPKNHVLIIDEINRGNISKILGELITLLEPDKRLGRENEMKTTLPYSGEEFGVPPNLYVIGTMNTADRSIAFMDVALRRRFEFVEMMPDIALVREKVGVIEGVDVAEILRRINERIESLYDRDHQIGHAYFLGVQKLADLRNVFLTRVIPLLQEYFYDDWSKLGTVLGCPYDAESGKPFSAVNHPLIEADTLPACLDHEDPHVRFRVADGFSKAAPAELKRYFAALAGPSQAQVGTLEA